MRYSVDWQDEAENAAPEERATVADLRVWLNESNVTQYLFGGTLRDDVTVALYGLVHGIAQGWWTIFGSRHGETPLLNYRSGYVLPDIRVRFDGAVFEVTAHQCVYRNPDVRFWGGASEVMSRGDGEALLADIVRTVLDRLNSLGLGETGAALRWKRVEASRQSTEAAFCEAAGGLGLDPYAIGDDAARFIERSETLFEGEALIEFVSGAAGVMQFELLEWVEFMRRHRGSTY